MMLRIGRSLILRNKKGFSPLEIINGDCKNKSLTGFTFIELLVVVILLGVVSALAVPNFRNTYYNFLFSEASHNLTYLMRYAQAGAVAERTNHRLNFDPEYRKYWLTKESQQEGDFVSLKGRFGKVFDIDQSITLESNGAIINFYPDGRIEKAKIYLTNKDNKFYTISTEDQAGYVQEFDYKKE